MECRLLTALMAFLLEKIQSVFRVCRLTGCQQKIVYLFSFLLFCYFLVMDVFLYRQIQKMPRMPSWNESETAVQSTPMPPLYYIFNGLSVKMIMLDHASTYVITPLAIMFNEVTHFSEVFYFITPNGISVLHICIALISAKFVTSDSLLHRRFGVLLFEFRTFLDAMDGIVYRARIHQNTFASNYDSVGHVVESVADVIGFSALLMGCMLYLKRTLDRKQWASSKNGGLLEIESYPVAARIGSFSLQIIIGAIAWAYYVRGYEHLLQHPQRTIEQSMLQNALLKSNIMLILMWAWRIISAVGLNELLLFCIFIDKLWEFLTFMQKRGIVLLIVFTLITQLHYLDTIRVLTAVGRASTISRQLS